MPKKSVLGHPDNVPSLAREGFSMNQVFTFTASSGMILPTWYDILYPGETVKGSPNFLLRSSAFLAPAMADVDCYVDLFFVPMRKIMSSFGEWFHQIDDVSTDFVDLNTFTDHLPFVTPNVVGGKIFSEFTKTYYDRYSYAESYNYAIGRQFDTYGFGMYRLLMHCGRNPQSLWQGIYKTAGAQDEVDSSAILPKYRPSLLDVSSPNFCPYWECAYQAIYMDYYRASEFESNDVKSYNLDSFFNDGSGRIINPFASDRRGIFELRYRRRGKDYFTSSRISPLMSQYGMMPDAYQNLSQVNQWLVSGDYSQFDRFGETSQLDPNIPSYTGTVFGFDLDGSASGSVGISGTVSLSATTGNDVNRWSYTDLSPIASDVPVSTGSSGDRLKVSSPSPSGSFAIQHFHPVNGSASISSSGTASMDVTSVLTTARIRTAFALEKLARVTQRAGKHYDDQTLAHFGYKVPQGFSNEVIKIGSWHTQLSVQKVTSTSDTQGAALGDQAAVGYAVLDGSKHKVKFTAPCEGIIMCLWSCAPRYKYLVLHDKLGYKFNLWDFYKPSLDNLGSQPLFYYELGNVTSQPNDSMQNTVCSWQWRFMESKVKFDRVTNVFTTVSKNPWSMVALPDIYYRGGFVSPADMNDLFNTQYDVFPAYPETGSQQDRETSMCIYPTNFLRDPFSIDFFMDMTKVSTMSTFGDTPLNGI